MGQTPAFTEAAPHHHDVWAVLTLYYRPDCAYALRVRLVLAEKQLPFVRRRVGWHVARGSEQRLDEIRAISGGRLPVLFDDSFGIFEPAIICEYLDEVFPRPALRLVEPRGRALMRMAMVRIDQDLMAPLDARIRGLGADDRHRHSELLSTLREWETAIGDSGHLFGMQFSLVDAWLFSAFARDDAAGVLADEGLPRLCRWFERIRARPSVQTEVLGAVEQSAPQAPLSA